MSLLSVSTPLRIFASTVILSMFPMLIASAADQWEWTAEVRQGTSVRASDPNSYPTQSQAASAMRALLPPTSTYLTRSGPGHGSAYGGSIQIEYTAPDASATYGEIISQTGLNPLTWGYPPFISASPLQVDSEDNLADIINEHLKQIGSPACADVDRQVVLESPLWEGVGGGSPSVAGKQRQIIRLGVANS